VKKEEASGMALKDVEIGKTLKVWNHRDCGMSGQLNGHNRHELVG
jgi:hypothetical protein